MHKIESNVRMAERSQALRSGRSPGIWTWVQTPLLTIVWSVLLFDYLRRTNLWISSTFFPYTRILCLSNRLKHDSGNKVVMPTIIQLSYFLLHKTICSLIGSHFNIQAIDTVLVKGSRKRNKSKNGSNNIYFKRMPDKELQPLTSRITIPRSTNWANRTCFTRLYVISYSILFRTFH